MSTHTAPALSSRQVISPGELKLRIIGGSRDGQLVRLRSSKCTIGSGRDCTLRLRARGVRPLHCLIVRGQQATIVRRWSPDTRLNGSSFTDASLVAGDRLSIGPIELEVVGESPSPEGPEPTKQQVARLLETEQTTLRKRQAEWEEVRRHAEERLERRTQEMVEKLADLKSEQQSAAATRKQVETERLTLQAERRKLRKLIVDHQQQQKQLEAARAKEEIARSQLEADLQQARAEGLTQEGAGLSDQESLQAVKKEQQEWEAERRRRESRLRLRAKQIEQQQENAEAELNEQKLELDQEADQLDQISQQLKEAVSGLDENKQAWRKQRERQMAEFASEARRMEQQRRQMEDERRGWEEQCQREAAESSQRSEQLQAREDELARNSPVDLVVSRERERGRDGEKEREAGRDHA